MKKLFPVVTLIALVLLTLACGDSTPVVRTPVPDSGDIEATTPSESASPTTASLGASRSNPAPPGSEVEIGDITLTVGDVVRPADDIIAEGNMFNTEAEEGNEYLIVSVSITCNLGSDETCALAPASEFELVGSSGVVREYEFVAGVDGVLESGEMFGGATMSGKIVFQVAVDETDLVLMYEEFLGMDKAYLALP